MWTGNDEVLPHNSDIDREKTLYVQKDTCRIVTTPILTGLASKLLRLN